MHQFVPDSLFFRRNRAFLPRIGAGAVIANRYSISGLTYCVAPVAELTGAASITLSDLQFTGQLHWAQK